MSNKIDWYLPDDETMEPQGPFTKDDIINKFKKGELFLDSFTWNSSQKNAEHWFHLYEFKELRDIILSYPRCSAPKKRSKGRSSQVTTVKIDSKRKGEYGTENVYRRYPRAPINAFAIMKNEEFYVETICVDISEKGVFLEVTDETKKFISGEEVIITIVDNKHLGTISINSVIINSFKKTDKLGYGIYFLRLSPQHKRKIAEYVVSSLQDKNVGQNAA